MNFLAPWFLLGALAVAGPVLFHLIRRAARERLPFSSLLFLRPVPPRATRRHKLEHIILLLLRCLMIVLLAAAFARPFFPKSGAMPPADAGKQTVILIDTSASMRRAGLWAKARAVAERYLKDAALADRVAVMTFDQQPRVLVNFTEWSSWPIDQRAALAGKRLESVSPSWGGTHLGLALTTAAEQFTDTTGRREIALISDMQEGAKMDGLQGYDWPKGVRVIAERTDPDRKGNAGLEILDGGRVRVANARDSSREKLSLQWISSSGGELVKKPMQIYVPPGQTRTYALPDLPASVKDAALGLTGDDEDFDSTSFFAAPELLHTVIAYFGSDSSNNPAQLRYYLERAFPDTPLRKVEVTKVISNAVPEGATFAVIPTGLAPDTATAVRQWISTGKTALLVLTNTRALSGLVDATAEEASGDYALLGEIDFTHPIFAPFADPQFSDFSRIHFWKHRRVTFDPPVAPRVLAKFDDGSPALAQVKMGQGNLLVLASGWQPADSQLALSSKFLPMMQTILDWSGGAVSARSQFQIGETIPSPLSSSAALSWRKPDGKTVSAAAFAETDMPGIYTVEAGGTLHRFAVNLSLDESRTAPLSPDELARLGVPLQTAPVFAATPAPGVQRHLLQAEAEARQKLWRWVIVGLLGVALVEILLGGWLSANPNLNLTPALNPNSKEAAS